MSDDYTGHTKLTNSELMGFWRRYIMLNVTVNQLYKLFYRTTFCFRCNKGVFYTSHIKFTIISR